MSSSKHSSTKKLEFIIRAAANLFLLCFAVIAVFPSHTPTHTHTPHLYTHAKAKLQQFMFVPFGENLMSSFLLYYHFHVPNLNFKLAFFAFSLSPLNSHSLPRFLLSTTNYSLEYLNARV